MPSSTCWSPVVPTTDSVRRWSPSSSSPAPSAASPGRAAGLVRRAPRPVQGAPRRHVRRRGAPAPERQGRLPLGEGAGRDARSTPSATEYPALPTAESARDESRAARDRARIDRQGRMARMDGNLLDTRRRPGRRDRRARTPGRRARARRPDHRGRHRPRARRRARRRRRGRVRGARADRVAHPLRRRGVVGSRLRPDARARVHHAGHGELRPRPGAAARRRPRHHRRTVLVHRGHPRRGVPARGPVDVGDLRGVPRRRRPSTAPRSTPSGSSPTSSCAPG